MRLERELRIALGSQVISIYKDCKFVISDVVINSESQEYNACEFRLNGMKVVFRKAKVTPKKIGQFVTFWKRNKEGITEPFDENIELDFYVINCMNQDRLGQFIIPRSVLIHNKIISTDKSEGKRGFRVYPDWDVPSSKQAIKTQLWQSKYFIELGSDLSVNAMKRLYEKFE